MNDFLYCVIFCCQNGPFPAETAVRNIRNIYFYRLCSKKVFEKYKWNINRHCAIEKRVGT